MFKGGKVAVIYTKRSPATSLARMECFDPVGASILLVPVII